MAQYADLTARIERMAAEKKALEEAAQEVADLIDPSAKETWGDQTTGVPHHLLAPILDRLRALP